MWPPVSQNIYLVSYDGSWAFFIYTVDPVITVISKFPSRSSKSWCSKDIFFELSFDRNSRSKIELVPEYIFRIKSAKRFVLKTNHILKRRPYRKVPTYSEHPSIGRFSKVCIFHVFSILSARVLLTDFPGRGRRTPLIMLIVIVIHGSFPFQD